MIDKNSQYVLCNHFSKFQFGYVLLNWKVGILTGWSVSTGKSSKYLYKWLSKEEWQMLLSTYFDGNVDNAWKSVLGREKQLKLSWNMYINYQRMDDRVR